MECLWSYLDNSFVILFSIYSFVSYRNAMLSSEKWSFKVIKHHIQLVVEYGPVIMHSY